MSSTTPFPFNYEGNTSILDAITNFGSVVTNKIENALNAPPISTAYTNLLNEFVKLGASPGYVFDILKYPFVQLYNLFVNLYDAAQTSVGAFSAAVDDVVADILKTILYIDVLIKATPQSLNVIMQDTIKTATAAMNKVVDFRYFKQIFVITKEMGDVLLAGLKNTFVRKMNNIEAMTKVNLISKRKQLYVVSDIIRKKTAIIPVVFAITIMGVGLYYRNRWLKSSL